MVKFINHLEMDREIPLNEKRRALRKQVFKYGRIIASIILILFLLFNYLRSSVNYKDLTISTVDKGLIDFSIAASGKVIPLTEEVIVSDLSRYKVDAEIADSYADYIRPGNQAIVSVGFEKLEGTVLNIVPSSKNRVVNFTVSLREANHSKLRSGLKTDVYVMVRIKEDAVRIRNGTYYTGKNRYNLWVIN
jgi:HlyD family secretion protein